jgi:hypothetical protein
MDIQMASSGRRDQFAVVSILDIINRIEYA